ncbi:MAG: hypothetical protein WC334_01140 [Kiritimatiellales bacterium]
MGLISVIPVDFPLGLGKKEQPIMSSRNHIQISFIRGELRIPCNESARVETEHLLIKYISNKGAKVNGNSIDRNEYKVFFPLVSWSPLLYSKDNFIGLNPLVSYGKVIIHESDVGISLLLKKTRVHYASIISLSIFLLAFLDASGGREVVDIVFGVICFFVIELWGHLTKVLLRIEIEKALATQVACV